jgi:lactoylglutathione lyase
VTVDCQSGCKLSLAIDQGWCKIYQICPGAHVGLVDEAKGINCWAAARPVHLWIRISDMGIWCSVAKSKELDSVSALFVNDKIGKKHFAFSDLDYIGIQIQPVTRFGA